MYICLCEGMGEGVNKFKLDRPISGLLAMIDKLSLSIQRQCTRCVG